MIGKMLGAAVLAGVLALTGLQPKPSIRDMLLAQKEVQDMSHNVVVYFAGWHAEEENPRFGGEVAGLPWDSVNYVNHAFWSVEPAEGTEESSFDRRLAGKEARTEWKIASMQPAIDLEDDGESALVPGLPKNHFAQYSAFSEKYPDVNIMISFGGWTRSGFFSEMSYTAEGRASFIQGCLNLMAENPWIDGIDIDWEYPAGNRSGERAPDPNEPGDQGCPIFGTPSQDRENFISLLKELKEAMAEVYGPGVKKLTACASGSTGWTLPCQNWAGAAEHLDMINIMSYDLAGVWDGVTGHASSAGLGKAGAMYFKMEGIPLEKVCMGSPLYGTLFEMQKITTMPLGTAVEKTKPYTGVIDQEQILNWEAEAVSGYTVNFADGKYTMGEKFDNGGTGWHMGYDDRNGGPYLYNDDEASPYYKWFLSYENPLSLQMKLDYIIEKGISGIIVWESSQDSEDYRMIKLMGNTLLHSEK